MVVPTLTVREDVPLLKPEASGVKATVDGLGVAVMPDGVVAVTVTAPLKPLTPVKVTTVLLSEKPRATVMLLWFSAELKPVGATSNAMVAW